MSVQIHPTAVVEEGAELGAEVTVDPMAVIHSGARVGDRTRIGSHAVISGHTTLGRDCRIYPHASVGTDPQDLKYQGEDVYLEMGDGNIVREFVTLNRGTGNGGGVTRIGHRNLFMVYAHVAHDCQVADDTVFANGATLAGHVAVEDFAVISAFSAVHQFCRVGAHCYIGGFSVVTRDVLPFLRIVGSRAEAHSFGINSIGLTRRGFSEATVSALKRCYALLRKTEQPLEERIAQMQDQFPDEPAVDQLIQAIRASERGFIL